MLFRSRIESDIREADDLNRSSIVNDVLRALKNMEILGQILRNKYGSLPNHGLKELVGAVVNAGLRLVSAVTDGDGIIRFEDFLGEMVKEATSDSEADILEEMRRQFRALVIFLVYVLLRKIADSIGRKELAVIVKQMVDDQGTTAYHIVGTFFALGVAESVNDDLVDKIVRFLSRCDNDGNRIARRLMSLETQSYLNTHWVKPKLRQKLYSKLGLKYKPNTFRAT